MVSIGKSAISIVSLSLVILAGCTAAPANTKVEKKIVHFEEVKKETGVETSRLSGTLQANEETLISFEVGGLVDQLLYVEGQFVEAGDVIAQLGQRDYKLQLEKANAAIKSSNASLASAQAALEEVNNGAREQERIQAQLAIVRAEEAFNNLKNDYERMKKLFETGAISERDLEGTRLQYITAKANFESAQQAYSLIEEGVRPEKKKQIEAAVNQAQAGLFNAKVSKEQAELALEKTSLKAPFSGVIVAKMAAKGQLVGPSMPIFKIAEIETLKVLLPVPDYQIENWEIGKEITLGVNGGKKVGKVTQIFPTTNQRTGTISVEVEVKNEDKKWFPGQVVKAEATIKEKTGIFVPIEAVISVGTNNNPFVFIIKDNKAVKTEVTVGKLFENKLEITSGLSLGDQVVTQGADRLFDGDVIEVEKSEREKKQ